MDLWNGYTLPVYLQEVIKQVIEPLKLGKLHPEW